MGEDYTSWTSDMDIETSDAGEWPSGLRRWFVGFRSGVGPDSIPSQAATVIVISCTLGKGA